MALENKCFYILGGYSRSNMEEKKYDLNASNFEDIAAA